MEEKKDIALHYHSIGYNCAQSVLCTFASELGLDHDQAFRLSEGLGRGMSIKEVCGVVSAMNMIIGLLNSSGSLRAGESKMDTYDRVERQMLEFKNRQGSFICSQLLNEHGTTRTCNDLIVDAVMTCEKLIQEK